MIFNPQKKRDLKMNMKTYTVSFKHSTRMIREFLKHTEKNKFIVRIKFNKIRIILKFLEQ